MLIGGVIKKIVCFINEMIRTADKKDSIRIFYFLPKPTPQYFTYNRAAIEVVVKRRYRPSGRSVRHVLSRDVLFQDCKRGTTHGDDAVAAAPEEGLLTIELPQML
ncbi:hypothetical protein, partial [Methylacidiphilum caldifontis]